MNVDCVLSALDVVDVPELEDVLDVDEELFSIVCSVVAAD